MSRSMLRFACALVAWSVCGCEPSARGGPTAGGDEISRPGGDASPGAGDLDRSGDAAGPAGDAMPADPCATANGGCDANADCSDVAGSPSCACRAPYEGDGYSCALPPMTVMLASPAPGTYDAPADLLLAADIDSAVAVEWVEFYDGATLLGSVATAPFELAWNAVGPGDYALRARARNVGGQEADSSSVMLVVNDPPRISISSPAADSHHGAPADFTIGAVAYDSDDGVQSVELMVDGAVVATLAAEPYESAWLDVAPGTYVVAGRVIDTRGSFRDAVPITVSVHARPLIDVAAVLPPDGEVPAPALVPVLVGVTPTDGAIAAVTLRVGGNPVGTATEEPYAFTFETAAPGVYALEVEVVDEFGVATVAAGPTVRVRAVTLHFVFSDHLGTPRELRRTGGEVLWRWPVGEPFGDEAADADPDGDGRAFPLQHRFPGQYFDVETGLAHNGQRDYEPATGRYIEPDPLGFVAGATLYGYAGGDPVALSDREGLITIANLADYDRWCSGKVQLSGAKKAQVLQACSDFDSRQRNARAAGNAAAAADARAKNARCDPTPPPPASPAPPSPPQPKPPRKCTKRDVRACVDLPQG